MASICALDLATNSGWAWWSDGMPKPRAGNIFLPDTTDLGPWLSALYEWITLFGDKNKVTGFIVEKPLTTAGKEAKIFKLVSAAGVAKMAAFRCYATCEFIANKTMIVHWLGSDEFKGAERKQRSVLACHTKGWPNVTDHNVADALGLLDYHCHKNAIKVPWNTQPAPRGGLFTPKLVGARIDKSNKVAARRLFSYALSFDRGTA